MVLGGIVGFKLFHPKYKHHSIMGLDPEGQGEIVLVSILFIIFLFVQIMNFLCHLHFSEMKNELTDQCLHNQTKFVKDPKKRTRLAYIISSQAKFVIVHKYGFNFVTCADYSWELVSWICFAVLIQNFWAWTFLLIWFMWHLKKA